MNTQMLPLGRPLPGLELDLIADLACPWSFLGKRSLERALENLYGTPVRALRWHGLPLVSVVESAQPISWDAHLLSRLPKGVDVSFAHQSLTEAGSELGIAFAFDKLRVLPDTREAHRLVRLAAREGRQCEVVDALFQAFFEQGRDIGNAQVLRDVAGECVLGEKIQTDFRDPAEGSSDVAAEEKRLRGLGVTGVPNLLINGHVFVPGPADVSTYVQALDQALFPEPEAEAEGERRLH